MFRFYAAFILIFVFSKHPVTACGYNFIGDCSTSISLKINGTQDSFAVASCPGVLKFDGFTIGSLESLSIARAKATTWESCLNNVSGVALYYRVYEQGFPGGSWQSIDLQENYNTVVGPYTTRYRSVNTDTDLTGNLSSGKTYVLEIYFRAEVDTIGDDFIPETTLLQNNNGQNYHFSFQYGGASAPPFVVVPTRIIHVKCYGDSTGVAGVSVYGNQAGLFYQWSTGGNNSPILSEIPAGTYTVTVTGVGGYIASDTIEIAQPMPLTAQFMVTGPGCSGTPGYAMVTPSGGIEPYNYAWSNGAQTATASFASSGSYTITVSDTNGCSTVDSVNIPAQPIVQVNMTGEICAGESFTAGGMSFTEAGNYTIQVEGFPDCDTVISLNLSVLNPAISLQNLPDTALIVCTGTMLDLCAEPVANTTFNWLNNGVLLPPSPCITFTPTLSGEYAVTATTTGIIKTCLADKSITVYVLPTPYATVTAEALNAIGCQPMDSIYLLLKAITNASEPVFQWVYNGQVISTDDTCYVTVPVDNFPLVLPDLTVTDKFGCQVLAEGVNVVITQPVPLQIEASVTNPTAFNADGSIELDVAGGFPPYIVVWDNNLTGFTISNLPEGIYCATVTDASGCTATVCETLLSADVATVTVKTALKIAPNPATPGQQVALKLPENLIGQEVRLEILDLQGRTLLRQVMMFYQATMYVLLPENLPAGALIIRSGGKRGWSATGRFTVH